MASFSRNPNSIKKSQSKYHIENEWFGFNGQNDPFATKPFVKLFPFVYFMYHFM